MLKYKLFQRLGGRGGIRTHGTLAGTPVFKTGALNHSATLPSPEWLSLNAVDRVRQREVGLVLPRDLVGLLLQIFVLDGVGPCPHLVFDGLRSASLR